MSLEQVIQHKDIFLSADHGWAPNTKTIYERSFNKYIKDGFPKTTYRAMVVRCLNRLSKWCFDEGLTDFHNPMSGGNKYARKTRIFTEEELKKY